VENITDNKNEHEVLFPSGIKFQVVNVYEHTQYKVKVEPGLILNKELTTILIDVPFNIFYGKTE
jgi:hypothetical protein